MKITSKHKRNAEREIGSICCAGCDGVKKRGFAFCMQCFKLLSKNGLMKFKPGNLVSSYMEALTFLLSNKGQKLRKQVA